MKYSMQKAEARANTTLRASYRASLSVARAINRKGFKEASEWLTALTKHEANIDGKFHDKAAEGMLKLLHGLEKNARQSKLEPDSMKLIISAHKGPSLARGRRRRNFGLKMKSTHLQAVLVNIEKKEGAKKQAGQRPSEE
jgi:ribosomal protein L22